MFVGVSFHFFVYERQLPSTFSISLMRIPVDRDRKISKQEQQWT